MQINKWRWLLTPHGEDILLECRNSQSAGVAGSHRTSMIVITVRIDSAIAAAFNKRMAELDSRNVGKKIVSSFTATKSSMKHQENHYTLTIHDNIP